MGSMFLRGVQDISIGLNNNNSYDVMLNDTPVTVKSRDGIGQMIRKSNIDTVIENMQGGSFYINNGHLVDWRDSDYNGFVLPNDIIQRYQETDLNEIAVENLSIAKYGKGGEFKISTGFTWSPFSQNLDTTVSTLRLVCENGMVAVSPMFQKSVPIINMFDHHLKIAADQTMHYANQHLTERLAMMQDSIASVAEVQLVLSHVDQRIKEQHNSQRLNNLRDTLVSGNFDAFYSKHAMDSGAIKQTLPSHLDRYSLMNIVTEMNTHTDESDRSSSKALDKLASRMLFEDSTVLNIKHNVPTNLFASPEQAFFG